MKSTIKKTAIYITLIILSVIYTKQASAQQVDVSYQVFYDQLSPYGQWVDYRNYGYVWIPDAGPDFTPYSTSGYWIMTEYGMTWVSNYSWGWAPFHYGRWDFDDYYGWLWVPGHEWGPAWVTWRNAYDYYGWMPMQPGISITISFGNYYDPFYDHWIFVRARDIDRYDVHRYCVNRHDHERIIRNSTVINNTYVDNSRHTTYISGPQREELHRNTGRNIRTANLRENNLPGQELKNDELNIYRPRIAENNDNKRIAPSRLTDIKEIKSRNDRNSVNQKQSDENIRKQRQNENQSDINKRKQEENINQSVENNRKQKQSENQSNIKKQEQNTIQPELNNRKQKQNVNIQNSNNRSNVNQSKNSRNEQQKNTVRQSTTTNNKRQTESNSGKNKRK